MAVVDLPGAFLHAKNEQCNNVHEGMVSRTYELDSSTNYGKYVTIENGQKVLYVKVQKALHGMQKSTPLSYIKLRANLESIGFKVNPYNPCLTSNEWASNDKNLAHEQFKDFSPRCMGSHDKNKAAR